MLSVRSVHFFLPFLSLEKRRGSCRLALFNGVRTEIRSNQNCSNHCEIRNEYRTRSPEFASTLDRFAAPNRPRIATQLRPIPLRSDPAWTSGLWSDPFVFYNLSDCAAVVCQWDSYSDRAPLIYSMPLHFAILFSASNSLHFRHSGCTVSTRRPSVDDCLSNCAPKPNSSVPLYSHCSHSTQSLSLKLYSLYSTFKQFGIRKLVFIWQMVCLFFISLAIVSLSLLLCLKFSTRARTQQIHFKLFGKTEAKNTFFSSATASVDSCSRPMHTRPHSRPPYTARDQFNAIRSICNLDRTTKGPLSDNLLSRFYCLHPCKP